MIGYKLTRSDCTGWLYLGVTAEEVSESIKDEIQAQAEEGLPLSEMCEMTIIPFKISEQDIAEMDEFPGW